MITLGQIAEWILKNRRKTAFINYTLETVLDELNRCSNDLTMLCITEGDTIVGVVTCKRLHELKVMFIYNILTTKSGIVKQMVKWFKDNYPEYTLQGHRGGVRLRKFNNIKKLLDRL